MPDATPAALPAVPEDDALSPRTLSVENSTPDDSPLLTSDASAPNFSEGAVSSHKASNNVFLIVLTGGPCGGKTTALDRLSGYLRERGFRVFTVPEAATMLFSNGVFGSDLGRNEDSVIDFQAALMSTQISLEDVFTELARATGETSVLLCDRGACDGKAYIDPAGWSKVIGRRNLTHDVPIREGRYHAVFHMVTAAKGAEPFYSLANNDTRTETVEVARAIDQKTQAAWMGHPRHFVFDNEGTNFEGKMRRVVDTMSKIVGLPLVQRTPTKFLLAPQPVISSTSQTTTTTTAAAVAAMSLAEAEAKNAPGEGGEAAAAIAAAAATVKPPGSPGRRPRGESLDSDAMAASLRKELAAVAREGESAEVQVFEVEKVYVLIGGKGTTNSSRKPPTGGGNKSPPLQPVTERASSPKLSPAGSPKVQGDNGEGALDFGNGALPAKLEYSFIRRRTQDGFSVYGHTTVTRHPSGERVEVKRIMSRKEYEWMKSMYADSSRNVVLQRRYCFLWQGKIYSLYRYLGVAHNDLAILHCQAEWRPKKDSEHHSNQVKEGTGEGKEGGVDGGESSSSSQARPHDDNVGSPEIPPFLRVTGPLDEDGPYSAYRLSLKAAPPLSANIAAYFDRFQLDSSNPPPPLPPLGSEGMPPRAKSTSAIPRGLR